MTNPFTMFQPLVLALLAILPPAAAGDDALAEARKLYADAFYEQALTALERLDPQQTAELRDQQSVRRYKALCLLALNRGDEAARVVNEIVAAEPMMPGDPADPPRLRDLMRDARLHVMPGVARDLYERGRQRFLDKAFADAAADFESVVALVDDQELGLASRGEFADLRLLARGFLDLSRSAAAQVPPAAQPVEAAPVRHEQAAPTDVVPPVAILQELPPVPFALRNTLRPPREAAIEVTVGSDGSVASATILTPSHPVYDALLVEAAKHWKYRPARRGGVPVEFKKRIRAVFPG